MELKANWQHDCDDCQLIGTITHLGMPVDVWLHSAEVEPESTLILRDGDEGPDYRSFPLHVAKGMDSLLWQTAYMLYRSLRGG